MAEQVTALHAFSIWKMNIDTMKAEITKLAKAGLISPLSKKTLEGRKTSDLQDFVTALGIKVVETVAGTPRAGMLETCLLIAKGNENHPLVKIAREMKELNKELSEALEPFNRTLSPGYIRSESKADESKPEAPKHSTGTPGQKK